MTHHQFPASPPTLDLSDLLKNHFLRFQGRHPTGIFAMRHSNNAASRCTRKFLKNHSANARPVTASPMHHLTAASLMRFTFVSRWRCHDILIGSRDAGSLGGVDVHNGRSLPSFILFFFFLTLMDKTCTPVVIERHRSFLPPTRSPTNASSRFLFIPQNLIGKTR